MALTAGDILKANDLAVESVFIPEWKGTVFVKTMSGFDRDEWESRIEKKAAGRVNIRGTLVAMTACDQEGNRLFDGNQVDELAKKNAKALDRIFEVAIKLNKIGSVDIEDLEKN